MSERGILIVVSAPSGCGKTSVLARLMQMRSTLHFSVSATTRSPREGEKHGIHYFFISREEFEQKIRENAFLEYAEYVDNYYGTPKAEVEAQLEAGQDVYLDIEVNGAMQVKAQCPEALTIFLMPPSMEELERRLTFRGTEKPEVVRQRLQEAERECSQRDKYDYIVINDEIDRAAEEISGLIDRRRAKYARKKV